MTYNYIGSNLYKKFTTEYLFFWEVLIVASAPSKCPMCGETLSWKKVDTAKKGFSVGKAATGAVLLGPIGLVGGALGKKKSTYYCGKCGFSHEYNG